MVRRVRIGGGFPTKESRWSRRASAKLFALRMLRDVAPDEELFTECVYVRYVAVRRCESLGMRGSLTMDSHL